MTKPKAIPEGIDLITRKQIANLTGCSLTKVIAASLYEPFNFPNCCIRLAHNQLFYDKKLVMKWLGKNDLKNMKVPAPRYHNNADEQAYSNQSTLDNKMALAFITGKTGRTQPNKKMAVNATTRPKTQVIRLEEHDHHDCHIDHFKMAFTRSSFGAYNLIIP